MEAALRAPGSVLGAQPAGPCLPGVVFRRRAFPANMEGLDPCHFDVSEDLLKSVNYGIAPPAGPDNAFRRISYPPALKRPSNGGAPVPVVGAPHRPPAGRPVKTVTRTVNIPGWTVIAPGWTRTKTTTVSKTKTETETDIRTITKTKHGKPGEPDITATQTVPVPVPTTEIQTITQVTSVTERPPPVTVIETTTLLPARM